MSSPPVAFSCPQQWGLQLSSMQVLSFSAGMAIQLDEGPLLVFFSRPFHSDEFFFALGLHHLQHYYYRHGELICEFGFRTLDHFASGIA